MTDSKLPSTRRAFLIHGAAIGAAALAARAISANAADTPASKPSATEPEVTPTEDLMREHGVLRRILLIHDDLIVRLDAQKACRLRPWPARPGSSAKFIQDYHEKLEEDFIFPLSRTPARPPQRPI